MLNRLVLTRGASTVEGGELILFGIGKNWCLIQVHDVLTREATKRQTLKEPGHTVYGSERNSEKCEFIDPQTPSFLPLSCKTISNPVNFYIHKSEIIFFGRLLYTLLNKCF